MKQAKYVSALPKLLLIPGVLVVVALLILPMFGIARFSIEEPSRTSFTDGGFTFNNYALIFTNAHLLSIVLRTFGVAALTTLLSLTFALPITRYLSKCGEAIRSVLTILLLFPLLAGNVVLSIGWVAMLSPSGVLSQLLSKIGLIDSSLEIMRTIPTLVLLMSLINLPMIVLSMQGTVSQIGSSTELAAYSLGASRRRTYFQVLLPQYVPGILVGTSLSFVLTVNAYATPKLIGGSRVQMAAPEIYATVTVDGNWPGGAALALVVVALSFFITSLYTWLASKYVSRWKL